MKPLTPQDLWPLPVYETVRDEFRKSVIAEKQNRRVFVGPHMAFVFENRLTVKFQVMEILRAEKLAKADQVAEELEGFNTMLPNAGELSATLLVELRGDENVIKAELGKLVGLGKQTWLEIDGARVAAAFDKGWEDQAAKKFSAVQYVRFPLGVLASKFASAKKIELVIEHPAYAFRTELTDGQRASLANDLRAD